MFPKRLTPLVNDGNVSRIRPRYAGTGTRPEMHIGAGVCLETRMTSCLDYNWTPERIELLIKLWNGCNDSAESIAAKMGPELTKNSIIGKVHRLRKKGFKVIQKKRNINPRKKKPPAPRPPRVPVKALKPVPVGPNERPCTVLELTAKTCKYPVGDPVTHFCGGAVEKSRGHGVYCLYHANICYKGLRYKRDADAKRRSYDYTRSVHIT